MSRKGEGKEKGRKKEEVGIWKSSNCMPLDENWHQISSYIYMYTKWPPF